MPELPEVETVRVSLVDKIVGRTIQAVHVYLPKIIYPCEEEVFTQQLVGAQIKDIARRGKYLLIALNGDHTLIVHLRMTGKLLYCSADVPMAKHTHVVFELDDDAEIRFVDQRQFGKILLTPNENLKNVSGLSTLGPEPLSDDFTKEGFKKGLRNKSTKIKPLLLDQSFLAGLGNIYVDEALFRARVHPERPAKTLNAREVVRLYHAIREVLAEGIKYRGTSVKDYVDGEGKSGEFQKRLKAYGRENLPCEKCGTLLVRKKVGGRSSIYCPRCQKL